jgi:hypothetical protein
MKWTTTEVDALKAMYETSPKKVLISTFPNRSYDAIKLQAEKFHLQKKINERIKGDLSVLLGNTNEAYYWMGFLYADGYFNHDTNRVKLTLNEKDRNHLEKFARYISCENVCDYTWSGDRKVSEVRVMDRFVFPRIVEKFLLKPKKTYNPPDNLLFLDTDEKFVAFFVGFIDADGYIKKESRPKKGNGITITIKVHSSWKRILQEMSDRIHGLSNAISTKAIINKSGYAKVAISKKSVVMFLRDKSVELNLPSLDRKWELTKGLTYEQ